MIEQNIRFLKEYNRLDSLCKDIFRSKDGVSEYIRAMENVQVSYCNYFYNWTAFYKKLKHMRWVRNQLAHEVGALDSEICTDSDIEWIITFHSSILDSSDPLTMVSKVKKEREKERIITVSQESNTNNIRRKEPNKNGILNRIKNALRKVFFK